MGGALTLLKNEARSSPPSLRFRSEGRDPLALDQGQTCIVDWGEILRAYAIIRRDVGRDFSSQGRWGGSGRGPGWNTGRGAQKEFTLRAVVTPGGSRRNLFFLVHKGDVFAEPFQPGQILDHRDD